MINNAVTNEHATVKLLSDAERDASIDARRSKQLAAFTQEGDTEMTMTCYAIAALDSDGKPIKYLPFYGEGWEPGSSFKLQSDPAFAWRFPDKDYAQERVDVMNATAGNSPTLHVIEMDCEGPPFNLAPPSTLQ